MQPGEQVICEIKRHPIGILGAYLVSGTILIVLAVVAFVIMPKVFSTNQHQVIIISAIIYFLISAVLLGFVFIANKVYWGNGWVVTSDSITQISQTSLFSKQTSQLSFSNLEDVTAEQNGVFQQLFKYGTLHAETAGEHSKFVFQFCPTPNYYAQKILAAREVFEQTRRGAQPQVASAPAAQPVAQPVAYTPPSAPPVYPQQPYDSTNLPPQ